MTIGESFIASVARRDGHLWVVITEPSPRNYIALVNLTTRRPPCDDSCIVTVGEHPFVRHESVVAYRHARMIDSDLLASQVQHQPASLALVRRMQEGALVSDYTADKVKAVVGEMMGR